ncbi:hypothetical protein [Serratia nevei]|uniref:hypothetical protein n=1 Tax=Serratia nevei TaxID=2703794 RepID=UPI0038B2B593
MLISESAWEEMTCLFAPSLDQTPEEAQVDRTLWLTTDVARQLINILEAGIAKIEATDYQDLDRRKH